MTPIPEIIRAGSRFYGVPVEMLKGPCREQHIISPRFSVMAACRKVGWGYASIGAAFNRDHGSVMHAVKQTTPAKFNGERWRRHVRFLELCALVSISEDPTEAMREEIGLRILDVEKQIAQLNESKAKLLAAYNSLTPNQKAA